MQRPLPAAPAGLSPDGHFRNTLFLSAGLMLVLALATILGALGFEHIGGYQPCALCLMERTPYYVGVPLAAVTLVAVALAAPRGVIILLFAAFLVLMLYSAGLGAYHAGVEWGIFEGPAACAAAGNVGSADDMLGQLEGSHMPSCTEATWRFLGLSFAGWNVVVSLILSAVAAYAITIGTRRAQA